MLVCEQFTLAIGIVLSGVFNITCKLAQPKSAFGKALATIARSAKLAKPLIKRISTSGGVLANSATKFAGLNSGRVASTCINT